MITKLLPLVLLLIGAGAGVGAGIFLRPDTPAAIAISDDHAGSDANKDNSETKDDSHGRAGNADGNGDNGNEFVKMNNQFVVPIVTNERVAALVVIGLSIEVPPGGSSAVYSREPKLRDSFLQVLFDHANMGGFDGAFTNAQMLGQLRAALRDVAQKDVGERIVKDVLIVEIVRQDY